MVVNNATDTATYNVVFNLFIYHMQNATYKFNHLWDLVKKSHLDWMTWWIKNVALTKLLIRFHERVLSVMTSCCELKQLLTLS